MSLLKNLEFQTVRYLRHGFVNHRGQVHFIPVPMTHIRITGEQ